MAWQTASDYNRRAKVEAAIGRWKQVIGDGLRSRMDECRASETNVAVGVLNRMLELGRPCYARIVSPKPGLGSLRRHLLIPAPRWLEASRCAGWTSASLLRFGGAPDPVTIRRQAPLAI